MVYAKYDHNLRLQLWDDISTINQGVTQSWLIGGDFNVVLNAEEKIGVLPVLDADIDDFRSFIESYDLAQMSFKGSPFTWWNSRAGVDCIFERLDRVLYNDHFQNVFANLEVEYLPRTGSDHAPLLISGYSEASKICRPFKFLNFWTSHETFNEIVKLNWDINFSANPFLDYKRTIKKN